MALGFTSSKLDCMENCLIKQVIKMGYQITQLANVLFTLISGHELSD